MLYLDTARLGQTCPSALQTQIDFARLAAEQPSSLYTDRFLAGGIEDAPECWKESFPGLQNWQGVIELKQAIQTFADAPKQCEVAIASRSTALMRASARAMFRQCNNVLTTDLSWPAYQAEIANAAARSRRRYTVYHCRGRIETGQVDVESLIGEIAQLYEDQGCDGVFLPAVDNFGVKLPIRRIIAAIEDVRAIRFVVIDGAQAIGHLPAIDFHDKCDVFLAGAHKWLRAGNPLGFAIYGHPRTRDWLSRSFRVRELPGGIDDALFSFTESLTNGLMQRYTETVSVVPLLTARSAIADQRSSKTSRRGGWVNQLTNRRVVSSLAQNLGWTIANPNRGFASGILRIGPSRRDSRPGADAVRVAMAANGVAVSAYCDGFIRLSMPWMLLTPCKLNEIQIALAEFGRLL